MKQAVVLTGGGSGGHITPILAVAAELKKRQPDLTLIYIGQTGDGLGDVPKRDCNIDQVYTVRAGKFRRYHGEGWKQLLDVKTMVLNIRDVLYLFIGFFQSRKLLKRLQPSVIFIKGGFVGVPVGLAAAWLRQPYITHDSDAIPGLANRIISRWATRHAVALPAEVYDYPRGKTVTTGIPLQQGFKPVTEALRAEYRRQLDIDPKQRMLFIIGGGLGSQRVNGAMAEAMPAILQEFADLQVFHIVGRANEEPMKQHYQHLLADKDQGRVRVYGYIHDVYRYSGAADLIVTRAGATNLAEFAVQGRACIIVPSPFLTGGHQLKNAQYLADQQAAVVLNETDVMSDANKLAKQISRLLHNEADRIKLGQQLATFSKPDASTELASLLLDQASPKGHDASR